MKKKKIFIFMLMTIVVVGLAIFLNKKTINDTTLTSKQEQVNKDEGIVDDTSNPEQEQMSKEEFMTGDNEINDGSMVNDYYVIYINQSDGSNTSYVPTALNPDFKENENYNISIAMDDDGKIINGDKIIVIDEYTLSDSNKTQIQKILNDEKRAIEAIREIQEQLNEIEEETLN